MTLTFEFFGGPLDGKVVIGREGDQEEADRYYALTHHAAVGQRFRTASEYAVNLLAEEELKEERPHHFQQHFYEVTDRAEEEEGLYVRLDYVSKKVEAT